MPEIEAYVKSLKQEHGFKKVGAIGFCWGGWAVFQLGAKGKSTHQTANVSYMDRLTLTIRQEPSRLQLHGASQPPDQRGNRRGCRSRSDHRPGARRRTHPGKESACQRRDSHLERRIRLSVLSRHVARIRGPMLYERCEREESIGKSEERGCGVVCAFLAFALS